MAERGQTWSDQEIIALLVKWADETNQAQLLGVVCNVVPTTTGLQYTCGATGTSERIPVAGLVLQQIEECQTQSQC